MSTCFQSQFHIETSGRGVREITSEINHSLAESEIETGIAHIFLKHTSASMMLCENADPTVLQDMETFFSQLVPDGAPEYLHNYEGDDDMPAHIRSVLTSNDLSIPITNGVLNLGVWQGVYLYEHRYQAHRRNLVITALGN